MTNNGNKGGSTAIPSLRYRNAPEAIEWLCKAFGFEKNAVYANPDGTIAHAQLTLGHGMVMLGSGKPGPADRVLRHPDQLGNLVTQGAYLVVKDCDAVYAKAKAAGAEMVMDIADMSYGGRGFSCLDLEGYLWSVGSYDPWAKIEKQ
jgi:uncharacterized glyoxalase superfamily protein PhnB